MMNKLLIHVSGIVDSMMNNLINLNNLINFQNKLGRF